jgi:hypothetical protein
MGRTSQAERLILGNHEPRSNTRHSNLALPSPRQGSSPLGHHTVPAFLKVKGSSFSNPDGPRGIAVTPHPSDGPTSLEPRLDSADELGNELGP